ncbi:uncharacterized protein LOC129972168 [Argiope bruennichi]|uniref:Uncharacterized protein n=1 Tax=Argiope bruennichi TaxID=94029 RepID=A0A8T0F8F1_ARGBR|nr:uncharacterized protein LOC129972168 [Argiope bruennichi]KAF8786495.1 hypothetical protein HNY73_008198 [Argiope bruennichi]
MGLFRHYARVFFRTHFRPIPHPVAKRWEMNSSLLYFVFAWTAFGWSLYYFKNNTNKDSPYASGIAITPYQSMRKFGAADSENTLIRIKGLNVEREVLSLDEVFEKCEEEERKIKSA